MWGQGSVKRKQKLCLIRTQTFSLSQNGYDSGARFDGISQASVPPPPPGVAPNAAQLAAASGAHVAASQKKGSFLSGGSGGGYTIF